MLWWFLYIYIQVFCPFCGGVRRLLFMRKVPLRSRVGGVGEVRSWECCVKRRRQKRLRLHSELLLCPSAKPQANRIPHPTPPPLPNKGLAPQSDGYGTGALHPSAVRWSLDSGGERATPRTGRLSLPPLRRASVGPPARPCCASTAAWARRSSPEQRSVGARGMSESRLALAFS